MVNSCCAYNCYNNSRWTSSGLPISFHTFPLQNETLLKAWLVAMRRDKWMPSKHSRVCSSHFKESDYNTSGWSSKRILKVDAVPSLFNFPQHLQTKTKTRPSPRKRVFEIETENHDPLDDTFNTPTASSESSNEHRLLITGNELIPKVKKRRSLGDFPDNFTSLEEANEYRQMSKNVLERKDKRIKQLRQQKSRLQKNIHELKCLFEHLKKINITSAKENEFVSVIVTPVIKEEAFLPEEYEAT